MGDQLDLAGRFEHFWALMQEFEKTSAPYPRAWETVVRDAVSLKREANYVCAAELYFGLMESESIVFTGLMGPLYKVLACAGLLRQARSVLILADEVYQAAPDPIAAASGLRSGFLSYLEDLSVAVRNEQDLAGYLRSISGNSNYEMPRGFLEMVAELHGA